MSDNKSKAININYTARIAQISSININHTIAAMKL